MRVCINDQHLLLVARHTDSQHHRLSAALSVDDELIGSQAVDMTTTPKVVGACTNKLTICLIAESLSIVGEQSLAKFAANL